MAVSILIPVYNHDIKPLVRTLSDQAEKLDTAFEIFCMDDGSDQEYRGQYKEAEHFPGVRLVHLEGNIGRSAVRNRLAKEARHDLLVYLDCDSKIIREDYLTTYLQESGDADVVCGGTAYAPNPPEDESLRLHWAYGSSREHVPVEQRMEKPYSSFKANNFCIRKETMLEIGWDESISGYGHEDTVLGVRLKESRKRIRHVDNPVLHTGLKPAGRFLEDTRKAVENLVRIGEQNKVGAEDVKLLRYTKRTRQTGVAILIKKWFALRRRKIEKKLTTGPPSMRLLNFYKLGYLLSIS